MGVNIKDVIKVMDNILDENGCPYDMRGKSCFDMDTCGQCVKEACVNNVKCAIDSDSDNINGKWIPIKERLPDETMDLVLTVREFGRHKEKQWDNTNVYTGSIHFISNDKYKISIVVNCDDVYNLYNGCVNIDYSVSGFDGIEVLAWMPLQCLLELCEPYKIDGKSTNNIDRSVFVINTPNSCEECLCESNGHCQLWYEADDGNPDFNPDIINVSMKPNWCPLHKLPEKYEYGDLDSDYEVRGWNNCINAIMQTYENGE